MDDSHPFIDRPRLFDLNSLTFFGYGDFHVINSIIIFKKIIKNFN